MHLPLPQHFATTAVSATSALGIAAAAAAVGCSSQDTWLVLLEAGIAPHTLEDTFPGILEAFAAAASAGGKTFWLNLEENKVPFQLNWAQHNSPFLILGFQSVLLPWYQANNEKPLKSNSTSKKRNR